MPAELLVGRQEKFVIKIKIDYRVDGQFIMAKG